jgi:hypothetical protein
MEGKRRGGPNGNKRIIIVATHFFHRQEVDGTLARVFQSSAAQVLDFL